MTTYNFEPLVVGYESITCAGYFHWANQPTPQEAPNFSIPHGNTVQLAISCSGVQSNGQFYGSTTQGSTTISSVSGAASLAVGQIILGAPFPDPSRISAIGGTTITFGNGPIDEDAGSWPSYLDPQGALATVGGTWYLTVEDAPLGTLAISVSPSTGVTITDTGADGGSNVSHIGNGAACSNLTGQGEASAAITFANAGTFVVVSPFTPVAGDSTFSAAASLPFTVTVT